MSIAFVTGSAGLVGAESVRFFADKGLKIVGIDNDMRRYFFGPEASTDWAKERLKREVKDYDHYSVDIREPESVEPLFKKYGRNISLIVHAAAQPSHDWAAKEPFTDFGVNAYGTLVLLEMCRKYSPDAVFIFTSTNKVYGDTPNCLPLVEREMRWEIAEGHPYYQNGIDESMSIDQSKHSVFGASKVAADIMVQEYGRYFGLKTGTFRGGCLTGPGHSGAALHGFLAYLMKCVMSRREYTVFGYRGKQVRDNIHSHDLVNCFYEFFKAPRLGEVYNIGGSRHSNCSMMEAIDMCQRIAGRPLNHTYSDTNRSGDHIWWISDVSKFKRHYPNWELTYNVEHILQEIHDELAEREGIAMPDRAANW
jgi:CDP-paratose 2-epimerase